MGDRGDAGLDAPVVASDVYTEDYYRHGNAGWPEWAASDGAEFSGRYGGSLKIGRFQPGEVVVDIGTGRGELLVVALRRGAKRAIGVEYSEDGCRLARRTLERHGAGDRAELIHGDARAIPLEDRTADLVTLLDVVEHLAPAELERTLSEALRILRPGGRLLVHTLPNRLIYDVTYRVQRLLIPWRVRSWPRQPRVEAELVMHVNEQSRRGLAKAIRRAGFADTRVDYGTWIHDAHVPERTRRLYARLARHRLTRPLGAADLWAHARRPAD
jgi:ubiquinone/menaquinone biosynthesis C-methylase UbiE